MPIYALNEDLWFPPPAEFPAESDIVALYGDVGPARLLMAYSHGIFPWYNEGEPIYWWCPRERMILRPAEVKISKSSRKIRQSGQFEIRADTAFAAVLHHCKNIERPGQEGSWLNEDLQDSLLELHRAGYAHSIEVYEDAELVGGLYGIALGKMFFGDSMFSYKSSASKMAFFALCEKLSEWQFRCIDCQMHTPHLQSLGAYLIPREDFLQQIAENRKLPTAKGKWTNFFT